MAPTARPRPWRPLAVFVTGMAALYGLMAVLGVWSPRLGLDLRGGTSITLTAQAAGAEEITEENLRQAVSIIRNRVDGAGAAEAEISTQGSGYIIVQVPGVGGDELVELVGQTAELRFRPVLAVIQGGAPVPEPTASPAPTATGSPAPRATRTPEATATPQGRALTPGLAGGQDTAAPAASPTPTTAPTTTPTPAPTDQPTAEQLARLQALDCSTLRAEGPDDPAEPLLTCDEDGTARFLLAPADVVGSDVDSATAAIPQGGVGYLVQLKFTGEGAEKFFRSTQALSTQTFPRNAFAIVLDGRVVSYPTVEQPIPGGQATITGQFTQQEARDLATVLTYGALPLTFTTSEVTTVSPTLGSDQLEAGLVAGAIGMVLVVAYSLLFYRLLGIVSVLSLAAAGALTYAAVVLLGRAIDFTLILAGVIGVIVAIGITADSFVVFFERIRDEIREGRSIRAAVEHGWVRARRTILVADAVTVLAAVVLYLLTVGRVQNFAFTLGLTTLVDVLVVFLFTKPLVSLLVRRRFFGAGHPLSGLDPARVGRVPARAAALAGRATASTRGGR